MWRQGSGSLGEKSLTDKQSITILMAVYEGLSFFITVGTDIANNMADIKRIIMKGEVFIAVAN